MDQKGRVSNYDDLLSCIIRRDFVLQRGNMTVLRQLLKAGAPAWVQNRDVHNFMSEIGRPGPAWLPRTAEYRR